MSFAARLPVTIIGGYLGAGKTTLLNRILTGTHGQRIAVIVNDFGALNVDAGLIVAHEGDTVSLSNGCVCCSASDGTGEILTGLIRRADAFDRIVIEMSGVAEPARLVDVVGAFRLPVDGVIVLVDAEQLPAQLANRYSGRAVARSLGQADLIVVNKIDLVGVEALAAAEAALNHHAPGVSRIRAVQSDVVLDLLFGHDRPVAQLSAAHGDHAQDYISWNWQRAEPVPRVEIEAFAANLAVRAVRAKGHVTLAEDPANRYLYQQVGPRWTLTLDQAGGNIAPDTHLVIIGVRLRASSHMVP